MRDFLDEFYSGRAQADVTKVVDKYTEWPDFARGNAIQIARDRDIRLVNESDSESNFEVRFKVIGDESNGKVELQETDVVQTFRLRRHRRQWKIMEPIFIPCISVEGELSRLKAAIPNTPDETFLSNARAAIALLESRH